MANDHPRTRITKKGRPLGPHEVSAILAGLDEGFSSSEPAGPHTALLLGEGAKLAVRSGHLEATDGVAWMARTRRWNRATNELRRLVVATDSGYLTLDAIKWAEAADVSLVVVDGEGEVTLAPAGGSVDARVLRIQAAPGAELATEAARLLLRPKLLGQAAVARELLDAPAVADTLESLGADLDAVDDVDRVVQHEAAGSAAYFNAWIEHPATTLRFTRFDAAKVPTHWTIYQGRRSVLTNGNYNRKADRPLNATLNLLYSGFAMIEARLAATAVGLSPALAFVHADQVSKDALSFDLIEPIRPICDRYLLELVAERTFTRADFVERADGSVRIAPKLVQELAGTVMPMCAKAVAPHAEALAHLLGRAVAGKWQPRTPLTARKARAAAAKVKARKAAAADRGAKGGRATATARRSDPSRAPALFATCVDCGAPLARSRHVRCPSCWDRQPAQAREVRRRRGQAIAQARAEQKAWTDDGGPVDAAEWERIRATIATVPLSAIMTACGVSKSSASGFRSGKHRPHRRHWQALAALRSERPSSSKQRTVR